MLPGEIVNKMYSNDDFSQWLGIEIIKVEVGHCILQMKVREEMTNGFDIAHGGISFSLADSALAFASNSRGKQAVSIDIQISHTAPVFSGDLLTAEAIEENLSDKLGHYTVRVSNQKNELIALFKGTVFRKSKEW